MKQITFPSETYTLKDGELVCDAESKLGRLELLFTMLTKISQLSQNRQEHKVTKVLRKKIKEISRFRDKSEDAMIAKEGEQVLILEDAEWIHLKKHMEDATPKVFPAFSAVVDELWDLVDGAKEYTLVKPPELVK